MIKNDKGPKSIQFVIGVIFTATLIGLIAFVNNTSSATGLEQYALTVAHLPKDAQILSQGFETIEDRSHPFGLGVDANQQLNPIPEDTASRYTYDQVYSFSAMLPTDGVMIADYAYRYASATDAAEASLSYISSLREAGAITLPISATSNLIGENVEFLLIEGDEGDFVAWSISSQANILTMVVTNGFAEQNVTQSLVTAVENLYAQ